MQNPTTKRFSCLSLTRAQEAQSPMKLHRCKSTPRRRGLQPPPRRPYREVFAELPADKRKEHLALMRMFLTVVAGTRGSR